MSKCKTCKGTGYQQTALEGTVDVRWMKNPCPDCDGTGEKGEEKKYLRDKVHKFLREFEGGLDETENLCGVRGILKECLEQNDRLEAENEKRLKMLRKQSGKTMKYIGEVRQLEQQLAEKDKETELQKATENLCFAVGKVAERDEQINRLQERLAEKEKEIKELEKEINISVCEQVTTIFAGGHFCEQDLTFRITAAQMRSTPKGDKIWQALKDKSYPGRQCAGKIY